MEKISKGFSAVLVSLILTLSFPLSAFAYEYGTPNPDEMIQVKTDAYTKTSYISRANVNRIRNSHSSKYKNKSDKQKLKEIFDALDFHINDLQFEEISKSLEISHISDISVETQYIKFDTEGTGSYITEEEAMEIVEKEKISSSLQETQSLTTTTATSDTSPKANHSSPIETVADGCMEMQITAIYTPNYHGIGTTIGRYCFLGTCVWLTTPSSSQRTTNAICFYSPDFRWPDKSLNSDDNSNYISMFSYVEYIYDANYNLVSYENLNQAKYDSDAVVSSEKGVFFEYDLQKNKLLAPIIYGDFSFLVFAVGNVQDYNNIYQNISIDLKYTFLANPLSISPSFSWCPIGVSVSLMHLPKEYSTHHTWNYQDDYYT